MPAPSQDGDGLRILYCRFMEEVKQRRDLVAAARQEQFSMPKLAAYEFCYLQLRFICELIGLACLAAHGDIPATKRPDVRAYYKPGQIFAALERLHPDFFPHAGEIIRDGAGALIGMRPLGDVLTKDDLKSLYDTECNSVLHRGSMKNMRTMKADFDRVKEWDEKLVKLLNTHFIKLITPNTQMWVRMMAQERAGSVSVKIVETHWTGPNLELIVKPFRGAER